MGVVRVLVAAALAAAGCKDKARPAGEPAGSGAPPIDWAACEGAIVKAAAEPWSARPRTVIEGCRVCGDWTPILRWNVPQADGGPTRAAIESAMNACDAFCTGEARLAFLGTLDKARGTLARTPWRQLGKICSHAVSAVPDQRFVSGPYFALDRIARAAGARRDTIGSALSKLELPLPAVTLVGTGVVLPAVAEPVAVNVPELHVTVLGDQLYAGHLPRGRLGADGVTVSSGPHPYPGQPVTPTELADVLRKLAGDTAAPDHASVAIIAPPLAPAAKLYPIISAASTALPTYLAARAPASYEGWELPGAIPVMLVLEQPNPIALVAEMTVQVLADELARRAATGADRIGITAP